MMFKDLPEVLRAICLHQGKLGRSEYGPSGRGIVKGGFQPDKICVEHASAKDTNRPGLQELLGQLRPGDTLLVHSIDRLCRNMSDMCAVTTRLRDQGVTLIF